MPETLAPYPRIDAMTGSIVPASRAKPRVLLELMLAPLRFTNALALVIHGLGHALALFAVTRDPSAFSATTILEGISFRHLGRSLLPFGPIPQLSSHSPRIPASSCEGWRCRVVAAAGTVANLLALAAASRCLESFDGIVAVLGWTCFCVSSILAMLSVPDVLAVVRGSTPYWACGPAFAVRCNLQGEENDPLLISDRLREMARILAREASTRGGQSAGFSVLVDKGGAQSVIFDKVVKGKRDDIVEVLSGRLDGLLEKAGREGYRRPPGLRSHPAPSALRHRRSDALAQCPAALVRILRRDDAPPGGRPDPGIPARRSVQHDRPQWRHGRRLPRVHRGRRETPAFLHSARSPWGIPEHDAQDQFQGRLGFPQRRRMGGFHLYPRTELQSAALRLFHRRIGLQP
ncbi:protein of unknown function [Methylococcus capsulatus]|uniref:Uncharacterized protein n=1 Tax=Methylococcus capsulatus TaxID=414 RepID=A0AA35XZN1_METCP|nr:protein of unknown function [Methylococcus capsulatus]